MKKGKTIYTYEPIGETFNVIYRDSKFNAKPELSVNEINNNIFFNFKSDLAYYNFSYFMVVFFFISFTLKMLIKLNKVVKISIE